jgi:cbb3-type cytochrome oxidase maturation protein
MVTAAIIVLIVMLATGFVTLVAFSWAASDRQFENFDDASRVIFDADEREGEPTDPALKNHARSEPS